MRVRERYSVNVLGKRIRPVLPLMQSALLKAPPALQQFIKPGLQFGNVPLQVIKPGLN